MTPPTPVAIYIRLTKSYEPNLGSFLDYMTIIASDTTLTNASDIDAIQSKTATGNGSSNSLAKMTNKAKNYKMPIIIK